MTIKSGDIMSKKVLDLKWMFSMSIWLIALFGWLLSLIMDKKATENILYPFIVLSFFFITLLFSPIYIEFDKNSLTIHFLFGFYQKLNWDTIWKVERQSPPSDFRYYRVFGDSYGKKAFFTSNKIPYNRKIRRLLNEYGFSKAKGGSSLVLSRQETQETDNTGDGSVC